MNYRARLMLHAGWCLGTTLALADLNDAMATTPLARVGSLADLSLEQLSSVEVTSVSKRVQRLADVAGSVYVISQEDIRRAGATSLPEALRLAPNLQVARADANQYAITTRGFNSVLANKMLVLIDGRTVYSPLFSGVFWEAQDVLLEDVERIEVLSGSGGTLYGSNAVNGVINIITRSAAETQGALASVGIGTRDEVVAVRFGGSTQAGTSYRLYAKKSDRHKTERANGTLVRDGSSTTTAGFRADHQDGNEKITLQADTYDAGIEQVPDMRRVFGLNILGRWSRDLDSGRRMQVQAYIDHTGRDQPGSVRDRLNTVDLEFQHASQPWAGHELLWGAGYRSQDDRVENINLVALAFLPANRRTKLLNVFVQDDFQVHDRLRLTLGAKAEYNDYTGIEFLPNLRLAWDVAPNHLLWTAASRSVRTPSRVDRDFFSPGLPPFVISGGSNFDSEIAEVYELGYRAQPMTELSYSVTLFRHNFDRLRSIDPGPSGLTFNNNFMGRLTGVEAWGKVSLTENWRLNASVVKQHQNFQAAPGSTPLNGIASLGNDPRYYGTLGSSWNIGANMELDVQARRVGALPDPAVPAYTAVDVRLGWRLRPDLNLSLTVRNLGDPNHPEFGARPTRAQFERSAFAALVWRM